MCLDYVDKQTKNIEFAWKVFSIRKPGFFEKPFNRKNIKEELYPLFFNSRGYFVTEKWLQASDYVNPLLLVFSKIKTDDGMKYHYGFHSFINKEDAVTFANKDRCVRKVLIKNIVASGSWCCCPCVVSKEMFICQEGARQ